MKIQAKINYNVYSWKEERLIVIEKKAKKEASGGTGNFYFLTCDDYTIVLPFI